MTVVALIPARGGSKGIPGKNLATLGGKPLIVHSIAATKASSIIEHVIVSTDSDEIASVCEAHGVRVPRRRAPEHATDTAGMLCVVEEVLDWCRQDGMDDIELVVVLQPTSPLRNASDIDGTIVALRQAQVESAVSVHRMMEHPAECVEVHGADWHFLVQPPQGAAGRQDYEGSFLFINGAVYVATPRFLLENKALFLEGAKTALYEMDRLRGIDINDPSDLRIADAMLAASTV
jgi:CMP-N-acetylneuraminic acid synthetase